MKSAVQNLLRRDSTAYAVLKSVYQSGARLLAIVAFWISLPAQLFRASRFVRLSPSIAFPTLPSKAIRFFDKKNRKLLTVHVRGKVDSFTADQILTNAGYEFLQTPRYQKIIANARGKLLIIDAGSNIGLSTRYFAETFPNAHIVAIEPDKANVELARKNCQGLTNIDLKHAALGPKSGFAKIANPQADPNAYQVIESDEPTDIRIITIQDILSEYPDHIPLIYKIDIEGAEKPLFASHTDWVAHAPILIVEIHDWMLPGTGNSRTFFQTICAYDRDILIQGENIVSVGNFKTDDA